MQLLYYHNLIYRVSSMNVRLVLRHDRIYVAHPILYIHKLSKYE